VKGIEEIFEYGFSLSGIRGILLRLCWIGIQGDQGEMPEVWGSFYH